MKENGRAEGRYLDGDQVRFGWKSGGVPVVWRQDVLKRGRRRIIGSTYPGLFRAG
jgi:hypothetical protein